MYNVCGRSETTPSRVKRGRYAVLLQSHIVRFTFVFLIVIGLIGTVRATEPVTSGIFVDVMINGKLFSKSGLIVADRTFVSVGVVAESVEGRVSIDPNRRIALISTGAYKNLLFDRLTALNPKVARLYLPWQPIPDEDHSRKSLTTYAAPGASLDLIVMPSGEVVGFKLRVRAEMFGHYAWFDQPADRPIKDDEFGHYYTQHLFIIDRSLIDRSFLRTSLFQKNVYEHDLAYIEDTDGQSTSNDRKNTRVAMNGKRLDIDEQGALWVGDDLYVPLRTVAENTGGGVGWDPVTRTASAKIGRGPNLTVERLMELNSSRDHYRLVGTFVPGVGYYYDVPGPGITLTYDADGDIVSFSTLFDLGTTEWQRWFDQPKDRPEMFPTIGPRYSIHHYVMSHEDIGVP